MSADNLTLDFILQRLRNVRSLLLRLHKALLESERIAYEQIHGRIQSSGEFFRLVIDHEWFSWLRPISQFIVQIDELLSSKETPTFSAAHALLKQTRSLLHPAEAGTLLEQNYFRAIQRDPTIALMHAELSDLLVSL